MATDGDGRWRQAGLGSARADAALALKFGARAAFWVARHSCVVITALTGIKSDAPHLNRCKYMPASGIQALKALRAKKSDEERRRRTWALWLTAHPVHAARVAFRVAAVSHVRWAGQIGGRNVAEAGASVLASDVAVRAHTASPAWQKLGGDVLEVTEAQSRKNTRAIILALRRRAALGRRRFEIGIDVPFQALGDVRRKVVRTFDQRAVKLGI